MNRKTLLLAFGTAAAFTAYSAEWHVYHDNHVPTLNNSAVTGASELSGVEQLRYAMEHASGGDTILIDPGEYDLKALEPISKDGNGDSSLVCDNKTLTLVGSDVTHWSKKTSAQETVLKGSPSARIVYGYAGGGRGSVFKNLTFDSGHAEGASGGAILFSYQGGSAYATNCVFRNCSANVSGATHYISALDCFYFRNTSAERAGAAQSYGNQFEYCLFVENQANGATAGAGALRENSLSKDLLGCVFSNNVASASKAGAYYVNAVADASAKIRRCVFVENSANDEGGALVAPVDLDDCTFVRNVSETRGGAVSAPGRINLSGCVFVENSAGTQGGAIFESLSFGSVSSCAFTNNLASVCAGGAYAQQISGSYTDCSFHNNRSPGTSDSANAGAHVHGALKLERCRFSGWGDIYARTIENCEFAACTYDFFSATHTLESLVRFDGGLGNGLVRNCLFEHCTVSRLIASAGVQVDIENCTFADNVSVYNMFTAFRGGSPVVGSINNFVNCIFNNFHPGTTQGDAFDFYATSYQATGVNNLANCLFRAKEDEDLKSSGTFNAVDVVRESPKFAYENPAYSKAPRYMLTPTSKGHTVGGQVMDWMSATTDLAGAPRLTDGAVDMGCYQCALQPTGLLVIFR